VTGQQGNGNLGSWGEDAGGKSGLAAGDAICRSKASSAGIPNAGNFKAWLSSGTTNAIDRLTGNGPWVRLDGVKVAGTKADLATGRLATAIALTEGGSYLSHWGVWTGTLSSGLKAGNTCQGWTDASSSLSGSGGTACIADDGWTAGGSSSCSSTVRRIYCFED
jgi:hypothetical protein